MILSLITWGSGLISLFFLLLFLPLSLFAYYSSKDNQRKTILLLISLAFLLFTTGLQLFILLAFAIIQFFLLKKLYFENKAKKRTFLLGLSTAFSFIFLLVFSFFLPSLLSFSLFGAGVMALLTLNSALEIQGGRWQSFPTFKNFLLFLSFYPRLFLGPFQSYWEFEESFSFVDTVLLDFKAGFGAYLRGTFQVVFLGLRFLDLNQQIQNFTPKSMTTLSSWSLMLFTALGLYHLLAGFSLLISGIARLYGLRLPVDTHYPYESTGTQSFLIHFHLSLSNPIGQNIYRFFLPLLRYPIFKKSFLILLGGLMGLWLSPQLGYFYWGAFLALWGLIERSESKKEQNPVKERALTNLHPARLDGIDPKEREIKHPWDDTLFPLGSGSRVGPASRWLKVWSRRLVTWLLFVLSFVLLLVFQVNWPEVFLRNLLFINSNILNNEIVYLLSSHLPMILLGVLFSVSWVPKTAYKLLLPFPKLANRIHFVFHLLLTVVIVSLLI